MGNILYRIQEIATCEGITIGAMERSIGASKGVLSRALLNSTDIQSKWLQAIAENYPQYSSEWLLTGNGSMLKTEEKKAAGASSAYTYTNNDLTQVEERSNNVLIPTSPDDPHGIPLIPFEAQAGMLAGMQTAMLSGCDHYVVPCFNGAEFLIQVSGTSMQPHLLSGDIVACKRVVLDGIFFQWNKVYVLDTDQGAIVKRVRQGSLPDCVTIVSDNPEYSPFELSLQHVNAVALVVGIIRLE